jgi:pimeloyl-ACP methyl ester carboxylesterase
MMTTKYGPRFILRIFPLLVLPLISHAMEINSMTMSQLGKAYAVNAQNVPIQVNTSFTGGSSVKNTAYQQQIELNLFEIVKVAGEIQVDPTHLGQVADIIVYVGWTAVSLPTAGELFYMLDKQGNILWWNQNPAQLVAFREQVTLITNQPVTLYSGKLPVAGKLRIFFGYRLQEGTLVTNSQPMEAIVNDTSFMPRFETAVCPMTLPKGVVDGKDVKCGYVTVPEQHANPKGRTLRLAVAIFPSTSATPAADPFVMEEGGPGGSTLKSFGSMLLDAQNPLFTLFRVQRDMVLVEQRGTLYSDPYLSCEEVQKFTLDALDQLLTQEEGDRRYHEAITACRDRLRAQGLNLSAYNSVENAADMAMALTALGYDKFNFYGVSYGTMLAQHLMRDYPERLRSVILDSVVPLEMKFIPKMATTADRSLRLLFAKCAADTDCNKNFPKLEQVFFDTVDRLNQSPAFIQIKDSSGNPHFLFFTGNNLINDQIFPLLYATQILPLLPAMIYRVAGGDYTSSELVIETFLFQDTTADGMFNSVICAEDADYTEADYDLAGLYPQLAVLAKQGDVRETCTLWQVEPLGTYIDQPVDRDIPTLVMSGEFDPVTPPSFGEMVAKHLSHAYAYSFPGVGHGTIDGGDCPVAMMLVFLENPAQAPDDNCIAEMGIKFAGNFELPSRRLRTIVDRRGLGNLGVLRFPKPARFRKP